MVSVSGRWRGSGPAPERTRRDDLDGLRGLAIALVAVFHIWFGRVSGGVDVFLVLSGYFFGTMLLRRASDPAASLNPLPVLRRLARRLLPAMVVVLGAAALLTVVVQPETRWESLADQSLASLGYYQNWYLAGTASDYTRAGEAVSPLQHLWSMSIQGQFYVALLALVTILTWVVRRVAGPRLEGVLVVSVAALTAASFVFATVAQGENPSAAYYNSFGRAWELLAGVLAAMLYARLRMPMWLRTACAAAGIAAIVSCGAVIDGAQFFPGPWALLPVGATLLVIAAGSGRPPRTPAPLRMLSGRVPVELGAIAYSLYLWHWPLLIFWLVHTGRAGVGILDGLGVLAVSLVLAYLTHRFVENPLRYPQAPHPDPVLTQAPGRRWLRSPTFAIGSVVALLAVALTVTSFGWREHVTLQRAKGHELAQLPERDYPGARALTNRLRVPKLPMRPTVLEARDDLPATTGDGCISDFLTPDVINCIYGDPEALRTIALAGGSHAEHWITALDMLGMRHGFRVVTYLKMGCPLTTELVPTIAISDNPYPQCHLWNQQVMDKLVTDRPDFVFTTTTRPRLDGPGDMVPEGYLGIWDTLAGNEISVLGMRDTPWLIHDGRLRDPSDCLSRGGNAVSCGVPRSAALSDVNPTLDFTAQYPLLFPLDLTDAVCDATDCRVTEGNVLIYHDSHHVSATYMRTMVDELGRQIAASTGWW
ncbi:acyltransferase family protein [Mycolicibacterium austroafricanum]|uniref:acyltransferase family protein n=1 Tax=Mycolicibacterium austroafricanum TaxID=39687 RepID=UPI001CA367BA|nr:acyltransferase family protein [Mycolicibacterium austroafricanum]QZT64467.1 acyltransferase [Mycolicibacterium austroafricanum]